MPLWNGGRCTPIAIPVARLRSFPNGTRGQEDATVARFLPGNKRFAQLWSHISFRATVEVVSRKERLLDVHIATTSCPLNLRPRTSNPRSQCTGVQERVAMAEELEGMYCIAIEEQRVMANFSL